VDAKSPSSEVANSGSEAGIVAASVYAGGKRVAGVAIEEAGEWSKRPGHVVWIGLFEPSYDLLARVQAQFDLHPLAIEDAGKPHQHPSWSNMARRSSSLHERPRSSTSASPSAKPTSSWGVAMW
jgi:hypothetical protein